MKATDFVILAVMSCVLPATAGPAMAGPYFDAVTADSPIAYWRLDDVGPASVNQGSIGTAANGTDAGSGTITHQVSGLLPGSSNTAARFDGASMIHVADNTSINTGGPYTNKTIELWFNADTIPTGTSTHQVIYEQGGSTNGLNVYLYNGELYAGAWGSSGTNTWVSTPVPVSGKDFQVVLTYDGTAGEVKGYLDGKLFGAATGALPDVPGHSDDIGIGARNISTLYKDSTPGSATPDADHFSGVIDEVALYNATLSEAQVQTHYVAAGGTVSELTIRGLMIDYDANNESSDAVWANSTSLVTRQGYVDGFDWSLTGATLLTSGVSPHKNLSQAYDFSGSSGRLVGDGTTSSSYDSFDELLSTAGGNPTERAATFEMWFKPDDLTGKEVLFETGGTTIGSSIRLNGDLLEVVTKDATYTTSTSFDLDGDDDGNLDFADFVQVVAVMEPTGNVMLYVNGELRDTQTMLSTDWSGGGDTRLGTAGDLGGGGSGYGAYDGLIAAFRYYDGSLTADEIRSNYAYGIPEPTSLVLAALGLLGLAFCGRRRRG